MEAKPEKGKVCKECGGKNGNHISYFQPYYGGYGQGYGEIDGRTRECSLK